jgi:hypothetical protein
VSDDYLAIKDKPARWAVVLAWGSAAFAGVALILLLLTFL